LADHLPEAPNDLEQAPFKRSSRAGPDYAGVHEAMFQAVALDYAITGAFAAAIDA